MKAFVPVRIRLVTPISMGRSCRLSLQNEGVVAHRERAAGRESGVAGSSPACEAPYLRRHLSIEFFRRAVEFGLSDKRRNRERVQIPPQPPIWLGSQLASCPSLFGSGRCTSVIEPVAQLRQSTRVESGRLRVRFPSGNIEVVSCPIPFSSMLIFDGSQDWVIA